MKLLTKTPLIFEWDPDRSRYEPDKGPRVHWKFPKKTWLKERLEQIRAERKKSTIEKKAICGGEK